MASPLENLKIAKPCPLAWADMEGDDRVRHCTKCNHSVYNFENLTTKEAENLLLNSTGRVCGRIYQRADGKVMTKDCRDGVIKSFAKLSLSTAFASLAVFAFALQSLKPESERLKLDEVKEKLRTVKPIGDLMDLIEPPRHMVGALPDRPSPISSSGSTNP